MILRKKTGILLLLCFMAVAAAVVWYCLLGTGKRSSQMDGTFVELPAVCAERVVL